MMGVLRSPFKSLKSQLNSQLSDAYYKNKIFRALSVKIYNYYTYFVNKGLRISSKYFLIISKDSSFTMDYYLHNANSLIADARSTTRRYYYKTVVGQYSIINEFQRIWNLSVDKETLLTVPGFKPGSFDCWSTAMERTEIESQHSRKHLFFHRKIFNSSKLSITLRDSRV